MNEFSRAFQLSSPLTLADGMRAPNGAQGKGERCRRHRVAVPPAPLSLASRVWPCEKHRAGVALAL